jgi:uncharacterized protein (TIGR01777 family)
MELKVAICGGKGLIGTELQDFYRKKGFHVELITRKTLKSKSELDTITGNSSLLINLAGEPITGRWTRAKRERIWNSRIVVTGMLVESLNRVPEPPELFIQASAIGIYKENSDEIFDEESHNYSTTFLGKVVRNWEDSLIDLHNKNIRTVIIRLGLVLGKNGGLMHLLIPIFRLGLGVVFNRGDNFISYIYLKELIRIVEYVRINKEVNGILNVTHGKFVTFEFFLRLLARTLKRPIFFKIPDSLIHLVLGEASIGLLSSHRILPKKLLEYGYVFKYSSLEDMLEEICNNKE